MSRRLHYYAQPYWAARREPAQRYEFMCALDAEEGGRMLIAGRADGVLVYQQCGDADADLWDDPEMLLTLGDVPRSVIMIDEDPPDPWSADVA